MRSNKFIINSLWLIVDKMYLLLGGFIVSIMVAKYLGPEDLGRFTYGIMLSLWCTTFSQWGASYFIFNLSSNKAKDALVYINGTEFVRAIVYVVSWCTISIYLYLNLPYDDFVFISVVILAGVFQGLDIYQYYFNGVLKSKYNARISIVARTISMSLRLVIVLLDGDIWLFILPIIIEGGIVFYYKRSKVKNINFETELNKENISGRYFKKSFPFFLSSILVLLFSKVNELVLQYITDFHQLGVYAAAMVLSMSWTFLPLSIGTSLLTKAISEKQVDALSFINLVVILISIPVCLGVYFFSDYIVMYTYGSDYSSIKDIIHLMSVSSSLSVLNVLNNRYLASLEGGGRYLFYKLLTLSTLGVLVTYICIDRYGLVGAAYSILLMEILSYTIGNYFLKSACIISMQLNMMKPKNIKLGLKVFR